MSSIDYDPYFFGPSMTESLDAVAEEHDLESDEGALIARILAGDLDCYASLIERHKRFITMRIIWRVPGSAVQDLVQETFIEAYRSLSSFRGDSSFRTWTAKIAARRIYKYWNNKHQKTISYDSLLPDNSNQFDQTVRERSEQRFIKDEHKRDIRNVLAQALAELSYQDRMVLCLLYFQECTIAQVAKELGMSTVNVKVRSHRAKKKIRNLLGDMGIDVRSFQ